VPIVSGGASGMQTMSGDDLKVGMRLVSMSGVSLADLASMDDLSVADILGGLTVRGRCGIGAAERYVAKNGDGGGERCAS
jgi:hypothetical protein